MAGLAGAVAPISARLGKVLVTAFVVMSSVFVGSEALRVWVAGSARVLGALGLGSLLNSYMVLDVLSAPFALLLSTVFAASTLFAALYTRLDARLSEERFWLWFPAVYPASLLPLLTDNMIVMTLLLDLTTLFVVLTAVSYAERRVRRAAITYVVFVGAASTGVVAGYIALGASAGGLFRLSEIASRYGGGPVEAAALMIVALGFVVKAGTPPFHYWLPRLHGEAPPPLSAVLSGFSASIGVYGIARLLQAIPTPSVLPLVLLVLGGAGIVYGSLYAATCLDTKRLAAYSTVASMSYALMTMGTAAHLSHIGEEVAAALAFSAVLIYSVGHGLAKAALFMALGVAALLRGRRVEGLKGLLRLSPLLGVLIMLSSLQLAGLPPSAIYISKTLMCTVGLSSSELLYDFSIGGLATVLSAVYVLRLVARVIEVPGVGTTDSPRGLALAAVPALLLIATSALLHTAPNLAIALVRGASRGMLGVDLSGAVSRGLLLSVVMSWRYGVGERLLVQVVAPLLVPLLVLVSLTIRGALEEITHLLRRLHGVEEVGRRIIAFLDLSYLALEDANFRDRIAVLISLAVLGMLVLLQLVR